MVDWSGPLEAVNVNGRRVPLSRLGELDGCIVTTPYEVDVPTVWQKDGWPSKSYGRHGQQWALGWFIRNVPAVTEPLSDVRADMERLVRTMSARETRAKVDYAEARRIAARLAPAVSADTLAVREVVAGVYDANAQPDHARQVRAGTADDWPIMTAALAAYAAARA